MSTPPPNRRPGVDADIVQASTVRGYDSPLASDPPCDLIVSPGQNTANLNLADVLLWSRSSDITQPVWIGVQGTSVTSPDGRVAFHMGNDADPNGTITASKGSLYVSYGTPALWQNQDGGTTWTQISDELGGENLEETLAIGDFTGSEKIVLSSSSPGIVGEDRGAGAAGGDVTLTGGAALGVTGNGGNVFLVSGASAGGNTGEINLQTQVPVSTGASGRILAKTADSLTGGNSGDAWIGTGKTGAPGLGGGSGTVTLQGGYNETTGLQGTAGGVNILGGFARAEGTGGSILIEAGGALATWPSPSLPVAIPGRGGSARVAAGDSSQAEAGGSVTLSAGDGGSAGAAGGDVNLIPGSGGGGFPDGEIVGLGVLRSNNIKRGTGNPNTMAVTGDEGAVYQRTDTGLGQLWLNTNGASNGWVQLAFAGDFIESWEQMNWGYLCRSGRDTTPGPGSANVFSDLGLFKGVRDDSTAGSEVQMATIPNRGGPFIQFLCTGSFHRSALSMYSGDLPFQLQQKPIVAFRAQNVNTEADYGVFMGLSALPATNQFVGAGDVTPSGEYVGFAIESTTTDWRAVAGDGTSVTNVSTGVLRTTVAGATEPYYFVIDASDYTFAGGPVRYYIFDEAFALLSSSEIATADLPVSTTQLGLLTGIRTGVGSPRALELNHASIVLQGDLVAQGAGTSTSGLTLAQVLINGNTTGNNPIVVNQLGGGLVGETDDNAGDGADVAVFGGPTTGAGNDSGSVTLASGNRVGVGGSGATGTLLLGTGWQFDAVSTGTTGTLTLSSGNHAGTGATGDVIIASGIHTGAGGVQGDILIAPGTFGPSPATATGNLLMRGGSTTAVGVTGGDVGIQTGENTSIQGDTGNLDLFTADVNQDGDAGDISIVAGDGGSSAGDGGGILLSSGWSSGDDGGPLFFATGGGAGGSGGALLFVVGPSASGPGAPVFLLAGDTTDGAAIGGDIELTPGTGGAGDGAVIVNGKLTVTGPIDPTAVGFTGVSSNPLSIGSGIDGILWVDDTGPDGRLMFENSSGSWDITTGGGATTLDALTDVTITAPSPGETLTLNGSLQWVNLPGVGGSGLPTVLGIDATTGGTAGGITVTGSAGDRIASDDDLVLDPSSGPGNAVVLDGLRWPEADGTAGYVLTTNGTGQLSWQVGGGGGGSGDTFAEQFASMQWGSAQAMATLPAAFAFNGSFSDFYILTTLAATANTSDQGNFIGLYSGVGVDSEAGVFITGSTVRLDARPLAVFHFNVHSPIGDMRLFVGLTTEAASVGTPTTMLGSTTPAESYIGVEIMTDAVPPQTNFTLVTDNNTGTPTKTTVLATPASSSCFWLTVDATASGQVTLTLYDEDRNAIGNTTYAANLPTATLDLSYFVGVRSRDGANKTLKVWEFSSVTRADLFAGIGGGGGSQDLTSVLGFGAETGGIPIQGDDNASGSGSDLALLGGSSSGGGGSGGAVVLEGGTADPGGSGSSGSITFETYDGAGNGNAGNFAFQAGDGGSGGGAGGGFAMSLGAGRGTAPGGSFDLQCGTGGSGGGAAGGLNLATGAALGAGVNGGNLQVVCGDGNGAGTGGSIQMTAGDGGATGDGGDIAFAVGSGLGGGVDGRFLVTGDVDITGKLTVSGMIDPPGLLMSDSSSVPFTATGNDGGIWVNTSGELIFTNSGGSLNISNSVGGGLGFLDALLISGYGFLGPGNLAGGAQSYGVYGSSVVEGVALPASINFGADVDGPLLTLAVGSAVASEAWVSTVDRIVRRDQRFKATFKFQINSADHSDERVFIGFSDGTAVAPPSVELGLNDPAALEYLGLREDDSSVNLEFVARGSGGAMAPVFALPTDTAVHYLQIDATAATGDVTFTVYDSDGVTISGAGGAQYTAPASTLLPGTTTDMRPFAGIHTPTGSTPRTMDFYYSSIVTRADVVDSVVGLGGGGGAGTLAQTLLLGNTTGGTDIELTNSSQIVGQDLGIGDGGPVTIVAGDETAGTSSAKGGFVEVVPGGVTGGVGGDAGDVLIGDTNAGATGIAGNAGSGTTDGGRGSSVVSYLGPGGANTTGDGGGGGGFLILGSGGAPGTGTTAQVDGGSGNVLGIFLDGGGKGTATATPGDGHGGDGAEILVGAQGGGDGEGETAAGGGTGGSLQAILGDGGDADTNVSGTATSGSGGGILVGTGSSGVATGHDGAVADTGGIFALVLGGGGGATTSDSGVATSGDAGGVQIIAAGSALATGVDGAAGGAGSYFIATLGPAGDATTTSTGTATGGAMGPWEVELDQGGDAQGRDGAVGGAAGSASWVINRAGTAEAVVSGTATGGAAGGFTFAAGDGGLAQGHAGATGGQGPGFYVQLGEAGAAQTITSATALGGAAGDVDFEIEVGGQADGISGATGGAGGGFQFLANPSGTALATAPGSTATAGNMGDVSFVIGPGAPAAGEASGVGGNAGNILLQTYPAGPGIGLEAASTATGGTPGSFLIQVGPGGLAEALGTADGGDGLGLNSQILGADGGNAIITATGGTATGGTAGNIQITVGSGGDATAAVPATLVGGGGGDFGVTAGAGGDADDGGATAGQAGAGGGIGFSAGDGGDGLTDNNHGGDGGSFAVSAGDGGDGFGTGDGGDGGSLLLAAGDSGAGAPDGAPGNVIIAAGADGGGGAGGEISLGSNTNDDRLDNDAEAMKFGTIGMAVNPMVVLFGSSFAAPPRVVQVTIEALSADFPGGGAAAMTAHVVPGTVLATGFQVQLTPAPPALPASIVIHWVAFK